MLYPPDILKVYLESKKDIIGSIYFKRSEPYDPVVFVKGKNPVKPYQIVDVTKLPKNALVEVDGLGFGGLFVRTNVYRAMTGRDKLGRLDMWMKYGNNFGIPEEMKDQESHDLIFCKMAQKYGFKIYVHTGIQSIHIGEKMIEMKDWKRSPSRNLKNTRVAVIMPTTKIDMANMAVKKMQERAGKPADYFIIEDFERNGFVNVVNDFVRSNKDYDYYVYVAQDAYAGEWWLKYALDEIMDKDAGLLAFNDGKWNGKLAAFGMVEREWMLQNYGGDLFYKGYNANYCDVELTLLAMRDNKFAYTGESVMVEFDFNKHGVNRKDKRLFNKRKMLLFNSSLQGLFE